MSEVKNNTIYIDDGTVWPHPETADAARVACAYHALLTHPWGTETSIKKLRMLRQALRKAKP